MEINATFALIIGIAVVAGCGIAGFVYWRKGDAFLASFVAGFFALCVVLVVFAWPAQPAPFVPESQRAEVGRSDSSESDPKNAAASAMRTREIRRASLKTFEPYRPAEVPSQGYVASDACRECHPKNHETWHASYHRTMTQVATPEAVIGNFDNVAVTSKGRDYRLTREGEVCYAEMHDPDLPVSPETRVSVPMVMTTGSHHMQIYWYPIRSPRTLGRLPIAYLKETKQWLPHSAIFLEPPDTPVNTEFGRWNSGCLNCHATHSRQRKLTTGTWNTEVSEFGISCEACHGPGEEHIALHRQTSSTNVLDPIVNPANLDHKASSHVCGQCHGATSNRENMDVVNVRGHGFRPGKDLNETHHIWQRDKKVLRDFVEKMNIHGGTDQALRRMFWDDGNVRVSGREFTGMERSPCYINGKMSCLSCHQLHKDDADPRSLETWANDQLSTVGLDNNACTQCHQKENYGTQHTHHPAGSSGASCYNCHMPHTSYGLLTAMRSHTITSPNVKRDLKARRPNACNLCHLDKTLKWTAQKLSDWYDLETPELSDEQTKIAASLIWLLKGDAGERALAASSMGWNDAHAAAGSDWIAPHLARLLLDPYEAVRIITRRSLRSLHGFKDLELNIMSSEPERKAIMTSVLSKWDVQHAVGRQANEDVLIGPTGVQRSRVDALLEQRDDTTVKLME